MALDELRQLRPDARIVNLETSITRSDDWAAKGINYRMSPQNAACLSAAAVDCCVLANNHVLDWGQAGLRETLATLERLQIKTAGAGPSSEKAVAPAVLNIAGKGRILVFSMASATSGIPASWSATARSTGVNLLPDLSSATAQTIAEQILRVRRPHDVIVVSLHWGPNWGYEIPGPAATLCARPDRQCACVDHPRPLLASREGNRGGLVTLLKEERKKAACRKSSSDRRTPGVHRRGAEAAVRRR